MGPSYYILVFLIMSSPGRLGASLMASVALGKSANSGDIDAFLEITDGLAREPRPDVSTALRTAAERGDAEMVKVMLPFYEHGHQQSAALRAACRCGSSPVVDLLMDYSRQEDLNGCFAEAAGSGNMEIVQKLHAFYVPGDEKETPLTKAAENGHLKVVKFMLDVCDPKANGSAALLVACAGGFEQIVEVLLPISNPQDYNIALANAISKNRVDIAIMMYEKCNLMRVKQILLKHNKQPNDALMGKLFALKDANDLQGHTQPANGDDKSRRL